MKKENRIHFQVHLKRGKYGKPSIVVIIPNTSIPVTYYEYPFTIKKRNSSIYDICFDVI